MDARDRKSVRCFLALTFGISAIFWRRSFGGAPLSAVVPFLMWTPGVCAIVTQLVFNPTTLDVYPSGVSSAPLTVTLANGDYGKTISASTAGFIRVSH